MAGGPSNPGLAAACAEAGALPFLAGGYKSAAGLMDEVRALGAATGEAFGVNLFVPGRPAPAGSLTGYLRELEADAEAVGAVPGEPSWDDDGWDAKLAALRSHASQIGEGDGLEERLRAWMSGTALAGGLPDGRLAEAFLVVDCR